MTDPSEATVPAAPFLLLVDPSDKQTPCKGLVFRVRHTVFWTGSRLEARQTATLLKRRSCPGCGQCGNLLGQIPDFLWNSLYDFGLSDTVNGKLYELEVKNVHRDWESGIIDDWDITLVETVE